MLAAIIIIAFVIYSTSLFFITNWYILLGLFVIEILIARPNKFFGGNLGFIVFVMGFNLIYSDTNTTLLFGMRLFLAIEAAYIVSTWLSPADFARGFCALISPLKIFRINLKEIELMITIALVFIPILAREATVIKQSLRSKGFDFTFKNVLRRPQVYILTYVDCVLNRIEMVDQALRAKGYE